MGLIQMFEDWQLVKKEKAGILSALQQTPPGAAISIKNPGNRITARALIELLKENPNSLEIMDFGFEVTIMRKSAMVKSMNTDSYLDLRAKHQILSADSVVALGLNKSAQLPAHNLRNGIPDDMLYKED